MTPCSVPVRCASIVLALGLALGVGAPCVAMPTNPDVVVRTLAGSGALGFADGAASDASFVMPFGLAYGPDGTLYVSDAGAQRIRAVDPSGRVRTIAGGGDLVAHGLWVAGGYRDGAGGDARFDRPAGIVWYAGALYVADTNNHCIRKVLPSGLVTTFAGSPRRVGLQDGSLAEASFSRPIGLAVDSHGVLYVADPVSGLRTIAPDGRVGRISELGGGTPYGVTAVDTPHGVDLFVSDLLGLVHWSPNHPLERFAVAEAYGHGTRQLQGLEPLGYPFAVVALDDNSVAYTDVRGSAVRYLDWYAGAPQVLAGIDAFDGAASGAGYRDGPGDVARFDEPIGIAVGRSGTIVVADSGSRRIRTIDNFDRKHEVGIINVLPTPVAPSPGTYRVVFIGDSNVWNYVRWSDSLPGIVESGLADDFRQGSRRLQVSTMDLPGPDLTAAASYITEVLAQTSAANLVVLEINPVAVSYIDNNFMPNGVIGSRDAAWSQGLIRELERVRASLRDRGAKLVVVSSPVAEDLSPAEGAWNALLRDGGPNQPTPNSSAGDVMNAAIKATGIPYLDGWAVFRAETLSDSHAALFGTQDSEHFSIHGRAVMGRALVAFLKTLKPWQ